jgi:hypothetical protein
MVRFARLSCGAAAFVVLLGVPTSSQAQELLAPSGDSVETNRPLLRPVPAVATTPVRLADRRPVALLPLYASFVVLQALDMHSTRYALDRGAVEGNPVVKGLAGSTVGMAAMKAAGTAGVILFNERLRTRNKAAAVGLMIATNSMLGWVVQHNYRCVR